MSIESSICDAIDIIVEQAVSSANYDRTVRATIVTCTDASIGCYKVKYQDSTFLAYGDVDVTYPTGCSVYVLIPGNDMTADKQILGTVAKLGTDYITTVEPDQRYEITGSNVVDSNDFTLSSYKSGTQNIILYSKDNAASDNKISLDTDITYEYLTNSSSIICGANFRTALPIEQQYQGNYGICFALDFLDNTENNIVTRYYVVDVNNMTGQPYNLLSKTRQYDIFDIDSANFREVNFISIFCYNFPHSLPDEECIDDIFISDIELEGANELSDDDINNYSLVFITPEGTIFTENTNLDYLTIEAQVRVKGNIINSDSQNLSFYWFTEHAGISNGSPYYCKYGGQGWKCLNNYNIIEGTEDEPEVVEWLPAGSVWTVNKSDVVASSVQYKCAVEYDGTVISKTITIKNLGSEYEITIESDSGTQFYFDNGSPTLTCLVNGKEEISYTYSWSVTNNAGLFNSLAETTVLNEEYNSLLEAYNELIAQIEAEKALAEGSAEELKELQAELEPFEYTFRVENNKLIHVEISSITNFSTYQCTVYNQGVYLGTASIILLNSYEVEGTYSLVINNGTCVYKYNESGISPASNAVDSPISIKALTFTIYDNLGQAIDDDIARHCDIKWIVPTSNTLIEVPSSYSPSAIDLINETETFSDLMSFTYTIANRYDITKTRNDIYLIVNYKDTSLSTKTHLTFLKEGESGTNGTEYTLKIVPNPASGDPDYWLITQNSSSVISHNYNPASSSRWLKLQFYHNEELVYDGITSGTSEEGKSLSVVWSILQNQYTKTVSDTSCLSVNASTGVFTVGTYPSITSGSHITAPPANIVQVTVVYDGITYYATYPVYFARLSNNNYGISLKAGTGFRNAMYTSDGRTPKYDNSYPFEIIVTRLINGYEEDVSTLTSSDYVISYNLAYLGRIYGSSWTNDINLEDRIIKDAAANQFGVKPKDSFDGECVTNAIEIIASHSGTEVARIHLPVYLYLNKYGLASLNGWDGNSIQISEDGGFILAPQIGAGVKNNDNSFTGLVMGEVKESGYSDSLIGLVGYNEGERTLVLDSSNGSATFGSSGKGQIIIDPSKNEAIIKSGNYTTSGDGAGLEINLTAPSITYGNGNFSVTSDGYLTAKGGGSIAGWSIDNYSLWTGTKETVSSIDSGNNVHLSAGTFSRTVAGASRSNLRMAFGSKFGVANDGTIYGSAVYLTGEINATSGTIGGFTISDNSLTCGSGNSAIRIGPDGITLGNNFSVTQNGNITASSGKIGNFIIQDGYITSSSSKTSYSSSTSGVYLGTTGIGLGTGNFYVTSAGYLYATNANITGTVTATYGTFTNVTITDGCVITGNCTINGRTFGSGFTWNGNAVASGYVDSTLSNKNLSGCDATNGLTYNGNLASIAASSDSTLQVQDNLITAGWIYSYGKINSNGILSVYNSATVSATLTAGNVSVEEDLIVSGDKNRLITTQHYGGILFSTQESLSPYFFDCGIGTTDNLGYCYIVIDPIFVESINMHNLLIFLTKYGNGDIWVNMRQSTIDIICIEGTPNLSFAWEIKSNQLQVNTERERKPIYEDIDLTEERAYSYLQQYNGGR